MKTSNWIEKEMQQKWEIANIYSVERSLSNWKKVQSSQEKKAYMQVFPIRLRQMAKNTGKDAETYWKSG